MSEPMLQVQIDAANRYEALYGAISAGYATRVADTVPIQHGQRVLDIACGTGILTREAALRAGPRGYLAGIDPNQGMLTVARQLAPSIDWHQGTAESLPFPDRSFDVALSQFGLMFFSDRQRALREMLRVLTTGGCLAVVVWDALDNAPAWALVVEAFERHAGKDAEDAIQALRAPYILGDPSKLMTMLADAGAASVKVATHRNTAEFPSVRIMVEAELRGWLPLAGIVLPEDLIVRVLEDAERALEPFVNEQGKVVFKWPAHIATGIKP